MSWILSQYIKQILDKIVPKIWNLEGNGKTGKYYHSQTKWPTKGDITRGWYRDKGLITFSSSITKKQEENKNKKQRPDDKS